MFPWDYLARWDLSLVSVYMPSIGRPGSDWNKAMIHLHNVIGQVKAYTCRVCLGGDLNASSLATLCGTSAVDEEGAGGEADAFRGRISRSLNRSIDLADLFSAKQLSLLAPDGGFVPTFVP